MLILPPEIFEFHELFWKDGWPGGAWGGAWGGGGGGTGGRG